MFTIRIGLAVLICSSTAVRSLLEFCEYDGLSQLVTESTRGDAILDLVITGYEGHILYRIHLGTSDHVSLIIHLTMKLEIVPPLFFGRHSIGI